jgi:hypothetical protein
MEREQVRHHNISLLVVLPQFRSTRFEEKGVVIHFLPVEKAEQIPKPSQLQLFQFQSLRAYITIHPRLV